MLLARLNTHARADPLYTRFTPLFYTALHQALNSLDKGHITEVKGFAKPPALVQVTPPALVQVMSPALVQVTPPALVQVTPPALVQVTPLRSRPPRLCRSRPCTRTVQGRVRRCTSRGPIRALSSPHYAIRAISSR